MNYLCRDKNPEEFNEAQVHEELKKGWTMFSVLGGSVYKDAIWDDLRTLASLCACESNDVKQLMTELVKSQPHNFY